MSGTLKINFLSEIDPTITNELLSESLLLEVLEPSGEVSQIRKWKLKKLTRSFMLIDISFDDPKNLSQSQILDLLVVTFMKSSVFVSIDS